MLNTITGKRRYYFIPYEKKIKKHKRYFTYAFCDNV